MKENTVFMKLKERLEKINTYIFIEEKIRKQKEETDKLNEKISQKKEEIQGLDKEITDKKELLESLKIEAVELKNFMNKSFSKKFPKWDYTVDIRNLYIIAINNKKYICSRSHTTDASDWLTRATGRCYVEIYDYYDVLNVKNHKYQYLYGYRYTHFDHDCGIPPQFAGKEPDYEEHILNLYPELSNFANDRVPNTYLKKYIMK